MIEDIKVRHYVDEETFLTKSKVELEFNRESIQDEKAFLLYEMSKEAAEEKIAMKIGKRILALLREPKQRWWDGEDIGEPLTSCSPPDPVIETTMGWFFYDEVWADAFGPFLTEEDARQSSKEYMKTL